MSNFNRNLLLSLKNLSHRFSFFLIQRKQKVIYVSHHYLTDYYLFRLQLSELWRVGITNTNKVANYQTAIF